MPSKYLELTCASCKAPLHLSISPAPSQITCTHCQHAISLDVDSLQSQLHKLERLCQTLRDCDEILSETCVGVTVGNQEIQIPYRLLLTGNAALAVKLANQEAKVHLRLDTKEESAP